MREGLDRDYTRDLAYKFRGRAFARFVVATVAAGTALASPFFIGENDADVFDMETVESLAAIVACGAVAGRTLYSGGMNLEAAKEIEAQIDEAA